MFDYALSADFGSTLMSGGSRVYRTWVLRLRCWAHLQRKLRGLAESSDRHTALADIVMLDAFDRLMAANFEARERLAQPPPGQADGPAAPTSVTHAQWVGLLRRSRLREARRNDTSPALRAVAREFLNDRDVIMRPVADPRLPLRNKAAERQLRHFGSSSLHQPR